MFTRAVTKGGRGGRGGRGGKGEQLSKPSAETVSVLPPLSCNKDNPEESEQIKVLRTVCWEALRNDDPDMLMHALHRGAGGDDLKIHELLPRLELGMWKRGCGKHGEMKRRGLLTIAAGNQEGVPPSGAVRCLEALSQ